MPKESIAIVGTGVMGITTAWYLAQQNDQITLIDQHPQVAQECSFANGGQLSICNAETWHLWQNLLLFFKNIHKKNSPIKLGGIFDKQKLHWLYHFLIDSLSNKYFDHSKKLFELSLISKELMNQLIEQEKIKFNFHRDGILFIFNKQKSFLKAQKKLPFFNSHGLNQQVLTPTEIKQLDPNFKSNDLIGGIFSPDDSQGDIYLFCKALANVLREKYAVQFKLSQRLEKLKQTKNKKWQLTLKSKDDNNHELLFDKVILASGASTNKILNDNHLQPPKKINIYPVRGYSITWQISSTTKKSQIPKIALIDSEQKIVSSILGKYIRVTGFAEFYGWQNKFEDYRIKYLENWFHSRYPHLKGKLIQSFSCQRPMQPSMLPVVKEIKNNLYLNSGGGHIGWTTALANAQNCNNLINQ